MSRFAEAAAAALVAGVLSPAPLLAQTVQFQFDNRPRITIGDSIHIDLRTKIQSEFHDPEQDRKHDDPAFELAKRRFGVDIAMFDRVTFEVDAEIADDDHTWKNVYADLKVARPLHVRTGRFKMPFSAEELTSIVDLPFIDRSLAASTIAPARDTGIMLHGRLGGRWLSYEAGVFQHDGDTARRKMLEGAGETAAARLTTNLGVKGLALGAAATHGWVPEGLNGLYGRTVSGYHFFDPVYVRGRRVRLGAEAGWKRERYQLNAEWMQIRDQRLGQGFFDDDLSDMVSDGWYASGTWMVRRAARSHGEKKPFFDRGFGDVELAARVEALGFGSLGRDDISFAHPRAEHQPWSEVRVGTIGVNWYVNRWAKIAANLNREQFSDPRRGPGNRDYNWRWALRLQWAM